MSELAPEFKQKIANFDGNNTVNEKEKHVMFYVESYAKNMPPAYLNKLISAIEAKLKNKELSKDQIRQECESAINELKNDVSRVPLSEPKGERGLLDKMTALASDAATQLDIRISSEDKIQIFRNGKNEPITVKDFETELKTKPMKDVNSFGLANYFLHLVNKKGLTSAHLINKLGSDKVLELGNIWRTNGDKGDLNSLLAKKTLENNGLTDFVATIVKLSSQDSIINQMNQLQKPEQQEAAIELLKDKYGSLRTKLKNEVKTELLKKNPTMNEGELNKLSEGILNKILQHKSFESLTELYKEINKNNKILGIKLNPKITAARVKEVQKADNNLKKAIALNSLTKEKDPKEQNKIQAQIRKLEHEGKSIDMAKITNEKITPDQVKDLISGKKKIEQVAQELQKEDPIFQEQYTTWKKENQEYKKQEKKDATKEKGSEKQEAKNTKEKEEKNVPQEKQIPDKNTLRNLFSPTRLARMQIGEERNFALSKDLGAPNVHCKKTAANSYDIQIGEYNKITLPKSGLRGYIGSYKLLQNTGLESMINIKPSELSKIIASCSKGARRVDNTDGFSQEERVMFLKSMANVLGVGEKLKHESNYHTVCETFKNALTLNKPNTSPKDGFKTLAISKGFLSDDGLVISSTNLLSAIKNQKKSA